jgi:hypothetical protein
VPRARGPRYPDHPGLGFTQGQGNCTGDWTHNLAMYDYLHVPQHLQPGEYVLGFRWDCESSAQVWQSCADVKITAPAGLTH